MKKNNKPAFAWVTFFIVVIIIIVIGMFIPKKYLPGSGSKSSSGFGTFQNDQRRVNDGVPGPLRWKDSFQYEKKEEKRQGSYMRYMIDKNNNK